MIATLIAGLLSNPIVGTVLKFPGATSLIGKVVESGERRVSRAKTGAIGIMALAPDWSGLLSRAGSGDWWAVLELAGLGILYAVSLFGAGNKGEELA